LVSSYSQLKRRNTSAGGLALEPDRHLEIRGTDDVLPLERASDDLPGGTATGLFLHAVLEHIPFDEVNQASDAASLLTSPTIRPIFERSAALFGVSTECLPRAAELVFGALNHPLRLGIGAQTTVRLGQASRILRELEFTYPIPEKHHPSLGAPSPSPLDKGVFSIDRGLLRGFIDLVFEFDGKVYVLDWKSDRLAHFHRQHIRAHVSEHYALQARIYLLALVRFLRIREETEYERRLGGAVYVFLRAMGSLVEPDYGVYSLRPSWGELCQWERELGTHPAFPTPSQRLGDQP
jgi:exodeoxyribonuclease V beta subunit